MSIADKISEILCQKLPVEKIYIEDESLKHANHQEAKKSQGGHFSILIVSQSFKNKKPLERHRMVYSALGNQFKDKIHALAIQALTPEEYGKRDEFV